MASKGAAGHVLTFLGAVILLPILRALGLRTAADSLAALLGHAPKRGLKGHQAALEEFYSAQAASYDATRGVLLKGREEMLERAMALILEKRESGERLTTWLDIGGGTGYNIEAANAILGKLKPGLALKDVFEKVYLVDLSPSLLGVARKRFEALKMQVEVVEADAGTYRPENWTEGRAGLVTFSYSRESFHRQHSKWFCH